MLELHSREENKQSKVLLILLCLFSFVFPFYAWAGTWCLVVLVIFWFVKRCNFPVDGFLRKLHWPFLLYFGWHLVGLFWTSNLEAGIEDLQSKSAFLLLPIVFATMDWKKEEVKMILRVFLFGVLFTNLVYLGYAAYRYFFLEESAHVFFYSQLTINFKNHPAFISSYSIFGFVYLLQLFFNNKVRFTSNLFWNISAALFLWLMVILYASRMQILAFLAIISLVLVAQLVIRKQFLLLALLIFALFGGTYIGSKSFSVTSDRMEKATSNLQSPKNIRFQLWEGSFDLGKKNVFSGVGTGDIKSELTKIFLAKKFDYAAKYQLNAHNQYLQSFATLGIVGLLIYLLLLFLPSLRALSAQNILVISFYLIFALGTLTECMIETQRGTVWLAFLGSLFWGREDFLKD